MSRILIPRLKLLHHDLGVAYRGSRLVCYNVMYVSGRLLALDIRELATWILLLLLTNNYISKAIHGKFDAPSTKVTPIGVK